MHVSRAAAPTPSLLSPVPHDHTDFLPVRSTRSQDTQLARLLELSRRKVNIEGQIIEQAQELAHAYEAMKAEVEAVLRGRSEDIHEAINTLNALEERASQN